MDKKEIKSYLTRKGWQDTKYAPPEAVMLHKAYLESGGSEIYEKEPVAFRRLRLLKTSIMLEMRIGKKWKKFGSFRYIDLELDLKTDKLWAIHNTELRSLHD